MSERVLVRETASGSVDESMRERDRGVRESVFGSVSEREGEYEREIVRER